MKCSRLCEWITVCITDWVTWPPFSKWETWRSLVTDRPPYVYRDDGTDQKNVMNRIQFSIPLLPFSFSPTFGLQLGDEVAGPSGQPNYHFPRFGGIQEEIRQIEDAEKRSRRNVGKSQTNAGRKDSRNHREGTPIPGWLVGWLYAAINFQMDMN